MHHAEIEEKTVESENEKEEGELEGDRAASRVLP